MWDSCLGPIRRNCRIISAGGPSVPPVTCRHSASLMTSTAAQGVNNTASKSLSFLCRIKDASDARFTSQKMWFVQSIEEALLLCVTWHCASTFFVQLVRILEPKYQQGTILYRHVGVVSRTSSWLYSLHSITLWTVTFLHVYSCAELQYLGCDYPNYWGLHMRPARYEDLQCLITLFNIAITI